MARPVNAYTEGAAVCPKLKEFSTPVCPLKRKARVPIEATPRIFRRNARDTSSFTKPMGVPGKHCRHHKMSLLTSPCTGIPNTSYNSFMVASLMLPVSPRVYDKFAINRPLPVGFPVDVHFFGTRSNGNPSISASAMCLALEGPNKIVLPSDTSVQTVAHISRVNSLTEPESGGQCDTVRRLRKMSCPFSACSTIARNTSALILPSNSRRTTSGST